MKRWSRPISANPLPDRDCYMSGHATFLPSGLELRRRSSRPAVGSSIYVLQKCLRQIFQGDIEINRRFARAWKDEEPLAGLSFRPTDTRKELWLYRNRDPYACPGHRRNNCDLQRRR